MNWRELIGAIALLATVISRDAPAADIASVSIEIVTEPGAALTASRDWYEVFTQLGISRLRIRSARGGETPGVEKVGTPRLPEYRVTAVLTGRNVLELPGGKFGLRDKARLKRWLDEIADLGPEGVTTERTAFGLTPSQLTAVQDDLRQRVDSSTQNADARKVVGLIANRLEHRLELDAGAAKRLQDVTIDDELRGVSSGTALAYVLHQAGLGFQPVRPPGGELHYRVAAVGPRVMIWPIGWKPAESPLKTCPDLFEQINVEVTDTPISEVLAALQPRLKISFLLDHAALRKDDTDIAKLSATLPGRRFSYARILQLTLREAKLTYELRVDDADQPLLWIWPNRPR